MNLKQFQKKLKIKITTKDKVEFLLEEVYSGLYGTKNRSRLILLLEDIKKKEGKYERKETTKPSRHRELPKLSPDFY